MAAESGQSINLNQSFDDKRANWYAVANSKTSGNDLESLSINAPHALLERIAEHPNAPESLLKKLAAHPHPEIRAAITDNPSLSEEIILMLCIDEHPDVRFRIAENHNMSQDTLKLLIHDNNPYVADRAERTLKRLNSHMSMAVDNFMKVISKQISPASTNIGKKLKILVIEDNPADAKLLQKQLAEWPFDLTCVSRLSTALECLNESTVDVILLDLTLPDAQGIDTFYQLHCQAPNIPIVVLTGLEDESVGTEAVQSGAQDYLVKGQVLPGLLARSIKYAIERHQTEVKIKQLNESLEQRIIQLATAYQELDRLSKVLTLSCEQSIKAANSKSKVEAMEFELKNIMGRNPE